MKQTVGSTLAQVIEKHLPATRVTEGSGSGTRRRSQMHALALLLADLHCDDRAGVTRDKEALEILIRAAAALQEAIEAVSWSTLSAIDWEAWMSDRHEHQSSMDERRGLIRDISADIEKLQSASRAVDDQHRRRRKAGKTNWRAASIAAECSRIWAEEEYRAKPDTPKPPYFNALAKFSGDPSLAAKYQEFADHMATGVTKSINGGRHAPKGTLAGFIEDVFEALGVVNAKGEQPTAAAALEAWNRTSQEETKIKPPSA